MTTLSSEFPYVLDRKVAYPTFEGPITSQDISRIEIRKKMAIRAQIGDLLTLGLPYEIHDGEDAIEVHVPQNFAELKAIHEQEIRRSEFADWKLPQGKMRIIKGVFGLMPDIQRFAMVDPQAGRTLLAMEDDYKIRDENRQILAEIFFPGEPVHEVRKNIRTNVNELSSRLFELVVKNSKKVQPEIRLGNVVYPLYAVETKIDGGIEQQLDFIELAKKLKNGKSA